MKKLVAFALVLSLGMFCAIGCTPKKEPPKKPPATGTEASSTEKKGAEPAKTPEAPKTTEEKK